MSTIAEELLDPAERVFIDKVISSRTESPGALLSILEAVQQHNSHNFLPIPVLRYIAEKTDIPLARIYSVATFYALFNLEPQGEHTICICRGTACHTRGSRNLLHSARLELGLSPETGTDGENGKALLTTADRRFTVRTVACFGQCALAPVVELDHHICGHVNERTLQRDIQAVLRESK